MGSLSAAIIEDSPYDARAEHLLSQLRLPSIAEMIRQESASIVYKARMAKRHRTFPFSLIAYLL